MKIIKLDGYNATTDNGKKKLELGTFDSYGEEQLQIVKAQNWENLSVIATFNPPNKKPVQVVVDSVTGVIKVPKEATANLYGVGTIVFVGLANGVQRISADVEYIVRKHSNANGTEPAEPTPSVVEQILTEAQNANTNSSEAKKLATDAKDIAQSVRTDADSGKFNGKDGAKGDKGETGTTPQLKIGEDNLWQVSYDNGATWVSLGVKATGAAGKDGEDGLTPHIGENGNWWVGDTDTGVSAKGPKGDPGPNDLVIVTYENGKLSKTYDELLADINANKIVAIKDVGNPKFPYYLYSNPDSTYGLFFAASPRLLAKPQQRMLLPFIGVKSDNTITANLSINSGTVPSGGTAGQVLAKKSDTSYVVQWVDPPAEIPEDYPQIREDVSKLKEDTAALQKRQNVLVGSETGNPASCNDAFAAPLCGLTVYGKSTQDGTPTLDAPVPIVSAGDSGTIVVTLSDGNDKTQTLTLPTPNGLPGIPVKSGGNYTDQNGQQWICDEVDLERGVRVQRVNVVDLSTCAITGSTNLVATKRLAILLPLKAGDYTVKALCNRLPYLVSFTSDTIHFYVDTRNTQVFIPIDAKNPEEGEYILFYVLDAPIETPLTPAEIAAYKALISYAPDTVVQASDGAGIKLDYQRDVNLVVKNLEDAIASMTTTT